MKDQNKTKKQLVNELVQLRLRIAELGALENGHKPSEVALRESEERYRSLFEGSRDAIYTTTREGEILDTNQSMLDLFGYSREEMIGLKARETYVHPEDRLKFQQKIEREGFVRDYEIKLHKKDGTELECLLTSIMRRSVDGNIVGYQGIIRDITDRKQAEEKVKQASEEWELTFNSIKDLVSIHDKDFRIVKVNKAFADTFGMENGELIGKKCYEIIHGTEEPWPNCPHRQTLEYGKPVTEEFWEPRRGRYLEVSASPIRNEKGEMIGSVHITKDITERKQVEEVLRASEERYRSYIEVTGQLGWATNADGEVLEDIPAWRKFTGQAEEEVKGMGWSKALHPDDVEHTMQLWNKAVATKSAYEVEYRIRKYDGVYRHFLARSVPVFKKDGSIHEWVGTCIDITDRKRTEAQMIESEERYRTAIEHSNDGVALVQGNKHLYVNKKFVQIFGYDRPEEIIGKPLSVVVHPDDRDRVMEINLKRQRNEDVPSQYEVKGIRKDGNTIYIEVSATKTTYRGEAVSLAYLRDITQRKRAEEALRESEERSRSLIETSPDVIALMDFSGKIIVMNEAALTTYGYESKDELIGRSVLDFIIPEDRPRVLQEISKVLEVKTLRNLEYTSLKKDGSTFSIEVNASLILDAQPTSIVIMIRDITERKQAEEEREKLILELKEALSKVKQLSGLLPICASCKKIRNDKGYWGQLESYISDHSEAEFTHGMCPDCMKKLYPDFADDKNSV